MDLLKELHQDGATICMVTHDPRYARHAERSIHLFDGQVVRDEDSSKAHELEESGFDSWRGCECGGEWEHHTRARSSTSSF
jgi:energy-coupling factor transporter ATP-binding protein EcfA2